MREPPKLEGWKKLEGRGVSRSEGHRESTKYIHLPAVMSSKHQNGREAAGHLPTFQPSNMAGPDSPLTATLAATLDKLTALLDEIRATREELETLRDRLADE